MKGSLNPEIGINAFRQAAPRVLYQKMQSMLTEMKDRTPVETGTLRDSGQADEPEWKGNTLTGQIGFGGAAEEYAIPVHEDLEAHHPIGQAKFAESVFQEEEPTLGAELAAGIAAEMK